MGVKLPELMETNRYSSATEVHEAIKNGDKNKFKELIPKGTEKMFDEYKENKYISLVDFIQESLEY